MSARRAESAPRAIPIALWLVAVGVAIFALATSGRMRTDMTAFMPQSKDASESLLVSVLQEGPAARAVLMSIEADGEDPSVLAARAVAFARKLRESGEFVRVNLGEPPDPHALEPLFAYRYLLAPPSQDGPDKDPFAQDSLRAALEARLAELRSALGAIDKSRLAADPTAAFRRLLIALLPANETNRDEGVWMSPDGGRALIVAETTAKGYDLGGQARAVAAAVDAFDGGREDGARLLITGPPAFAVAASSAIRGEAKVLGVSASVLLAGFLLMVYGSPRMVLLGAVPVASAMLVGAAAVSYVFDGIHGITVAFGITLLGVTLDYPLHLFSHATGAASLHTSARLIWPTLRLGALTSVFAFAALGLSRFAGMSELALFAACGLVTASLCTRFVLPALFPIAWRNRKALPAILTRRGAPSGRGRRMRLAAAIALAGSGGVFAVHLARAPASVLWENDLAALSPVPASSVALDRELRKALAAPDVRHALVLRAASVSAALELSESVSPVLEQLRASGAIDGFEAPSRYLPSARTQAARQAALPDAHTLAGRLERARVGLPFRPGAFAPFIEDVQAARTLEPLDLDDLSDTPLALRLRAMILELDDEGQQAVAALVQLIGVNKADAVAQAIDQWRTGIPGAASSSYIDIKQASDRVVTAYRDDALRLLGLAIPALALVLWFGTRSVSRLGTCALALGLAVVVDLGLLAAMGTRLSVFHLIAVVLVAGIGLDYGLFFSRPDDDSDTRARTLHAVCVCALSTVLVFGLLATSVLPVLRAVGATVAIGVALAFLSTLLLTRYR